MQRLRRIVVSCIGPGAVFAALALAGCGEVGGVGRLIIDPSHFDGYHCKGLVTQWKALVEREKQLRALMSKADEGTAGAVIGTLTYRTDYETVMSEEKLLQRTAAEKNCVLVATYQSDQTIH